jgi:hypothetical protein
MFGENHAKKNDTLMDEKIQKYKKHTFKQKLYPNYRRQHKNQQNSNNIYQINDSCQEIIQNKNINKNIICPKVITINLSNIDNINSFPYIDSHIKYIENLLTPFILSRLEELNNEFKECNFDVIRMINDVVDES